MGDRHVSAPGAGTRLARRAFIARSTLALGASLGLLAACGAPSASPTSAPAQSAAPTAASSQPTAAAAQPTSAAQSAATAAPAPTAAAAAKPAPGTEIVYLNQSRGQRKAMEDLADQYSKANGLKVTIDTPGPADYVAKLQAAAAAGNMPDTYFGLGEVTMAPFFKAGWALNLKPEMDKGWGKSFKPWFLQVIEMAEGNSLEIPPGIYRAPWAATTMMFLYNRELFQKAKLDPQKPPATTPEFLDALKASVAAGSPGFVTAITYYTDMLRHYASNWLTDEEIEATQQGKAPWSADGWKQAMKLFDDLREAKVIHPLALSDTAGVDSDKAFFNTQEVLTYFTGNWSIPVQWATAPDFKNYSAFAIPKAPEGKQDPRLPIGIDKTGCVNPKGKYVDASFAYIKWLTEKDQQVYLAKNVPVIPTLQDIDPKLLPEQLAPFAAAMDHPMKVLSPVLAPVNEAIYKGIVSLLLKEKTADQILSEADKAQKG